MEIGFSFTKVFHKSARMSLAVKFRNVLFLLSFFFFLFFCFIFCFIYFCFEGMLAYFTCRQTSVGKKFPV